MSSHSSAPGFHPSNSRSAPELLDHSAPIHNHPESVLSDPCRSSPWKDSSDGQSFLHPADYAAPPASGFSHCCCSFSAWNLVDISLTEAGSVLVSQGDIFRVIVLKFDSEACFPGKSPYAVREFTGEIIKQSNGPIRSNPIDEHR